MISEVADMTYQGAILIIVKAMLEAVRDEFHITNEQVECFYEKFMLKLPKSMQCPLQAE